MCDQKKPNIIGEGLAFLVLSFDKYKITHIKMTTFLSKYDEICYFARQKYHVFDVLKVKDFHFLLVIVHNQTCAMELSDLLKNVRSAKPSLPIILYSFVSNWWLSMDLNPLLFDGLACGALQLEEAASVAERAVLRRKAACKFLNMKPDSAQSSNPSFQCEGAS